RDERARLAARDDEAREAEVRDALELLPELLDRLAREHVDLLPGRVDREHADRAATRRLEPPEPRGFLDHGLGAHESDSTTIEAPWPPPTHSVARPSPPPRRRSSSSNVSTRRVPLTPTG